jgi:hypothetical protein
MGARVATHGGPSRILQEQIAVRAPVLVTRGCRHRTYFSWCRRAIGHARNCPGVARSPTGRVRQLHQIGRRESTGSCENSSRVPSRASERKRARQTPAGTYPAPHSRLAALVASVGDLTGIDDTITIYTR